MLGCFYGQRRPSSIPPPLPNISTSSSDYPSDVLLSNFNSLYDPISFPHTPTHSSSQTGLKRIIDDPDAISSAISTRRLFPAFPGRSKSIIDSAAVSVGVLGSAVAVPTYSPEPYWDFRRSMEEMVAALGVGAHIDLAMLRELLLCYLSLNRKHAYKYIVTAFADLLLGLSTTAGDC
ncbi:hypothetical protein MA16_Dca025717 [Dendrobium catenatum]|uniref:Transcription repressor n=1 Tax=Dendrobium catenatum TaxID=906689 RepID=A0A2I0WWQ7_9ASPA|nr:hypothetical protein MA16_Dca025717 [Dendrobium catenatum]